MASTAPGLGPPYHPCRTGLCAGTYSLTAALAAIRGNMKHTLAVLITALLAAPLAQAGDVSYGVSLYGRSYHHDLPQGERSKLNESNIGFALYRVVTVEKNRFMLEAGTFQNSYYDQAYWIGGQYSYRLFKYLEPGLMLRHWETAHGTYPQKPMNKYLMVSVPFTDKVRVSAIVRASGYVAFLSLDF
jgi:hypothetical protein